MSSILLSATNFADFFVTGKDPITLFGHLVEDQNHAFFIDSVILFNHNLAFTALSFPVESAYHTQLSSIISLS